MKKLLILLAMAPTLNLHAQSPSGAELRLPVSTVTDKIRGGLLGQMLGNLNGIPHEHKYIHAPGNVEQYMPALPGGAWTDDDTDFEWVYIFEMQRRRQVLLPYDTIAALWKGRINKNIWCSNRYARHLMDMGFLPPLTGDPLLNPWAAFNVSGQFLCETFGLLAPAMPATAAEIGLHYTRVAIGGEPAQTTQFFTAMIAMAFVNNDVDSLLNAGMAAVDRRSHTFQLIDSVRNWHRQNPGDWKKARQLLHDRYTRENGGLRDKNGTELNTGAIVMALLYGKGDFAESLRLAFNLGWDADCNAATVGSILGAMRGYRKMLANGWKITDRYANTSRDHMPADETITSFADRLVELFEMVNEQQGGRRELSGGRPVYLIRQQRPAPVLLQKTGKERQAGLPGEDPLRQLTLGITTGTNPEKARAAYMAVCLGFDRRLARSHPQAWREAKAQLGGYWKVMNNIFSEGFNDLAAFRKKFEEAGFRAPRQRYADSVIYGDAVYWKQPEEAR
ncbi:ADP-ribosylglycohydrolase family protein [Chitinophaga sp. GCM10012297]|uniref:ADP-ribosylglycohydrolase family protein n=1 Tax=Chitinophaga chungangae TaxID=2821488 RepID=A0ABS3YA26_9BACT|nr:ADP-ribosylglycohydrolase family protein [Chitinophaga chungangae]MBO9151345.1 ADP-ribosylglycohydrolase family protein [Chitinophaga chungangae]